MHENDSFLYGGGSKCLKIYFDVKATAKQKKKNVNFYGSAAIVI